MKCSSKPKFELRCNQRIDSDLIAAGCKTKENPVPRISTKKKWQIFTATAATGVGWDPFISNAVGDNPTDFVYLSAFQSAGHVMMHWRHSCTNRWPIACAPLGEWQLDSSSCFWWCFLLLKHAETIWFPQIRDVWWYISTLGWWFVLITQATYVFWISMWVFLRSCRLESTGGPRNSGRLLVSGVSYFRSWFSFNIGSTQVMTGEVDTMNDTNGNLSSFLYAPSGMVPIVAGRWGQVQRLRLMVRVWLREAWEHCAVDDPTRDFTRIKMIFHKQNKRKQYV